MTPSAMSRPTVALFSKTSERRVVEDCGQSYLWSTEPIHERKAWFPIQTLGGHGLPPFFRSWPSLSVCGKTARQ